MEINMGNIKKYTNERNVQIVISLLKAHGINRVVASPGTTNMTFIASIERDSFFKIYSSVDERSAAYIACGLANEGEPVVLSCTGATASRNYMPGLTEAYYRKLPILAITSHRGTSRIGHLLDQQIDRRQLPNDIAIESVTIPFVKDVDDENFCVIEANKAILALKHHGGGPVHINMFSAYSLDFSVKELAPVRVIQRYEFSEDLPKIPDGKIAIFVGSHLPFSDEEIQSIDNFCGEHDAVVFCDHTSNYTGKYGIHYALVCGQKEYFSETRRVSLLIHIGEISGALYGHWIDSKEVWRINQDGALRNTFGKLTKVFEMPEHIFFEHYTKSRNQLSTYLNDCKAEYQKVLSSIPELPFGNIWIAQQLHDKLPENSVFHMGILNSLRSWNFFEISNTIRTSCNVGGFGIDGGLSTLIGASLNHPDKLHLGVFGDLAFFYDMNVMGNRHVGNNIRIMLINNGRGTEFRNYDHPCYPLGEEADLFIAAAGHYGNQSPDLVRHYAEDLGYQYIPVRGKEDFLQVYSEFINPQITDSSMIMEVFTESALESEALEMVLNCVKPTIKKQISKSIKRVIGDNYVNSLKNKFRN